MKKLNIFSLAALLACGLLTSSCEKQSDSVVPSLVAASTASDSKVKGIDNPYTTVGIEYPESSEATGLYQLDASGNPVLDINGQKIGTTIMMNLTKVIETGNGEIYFLETLPGREVGSQFRPLQGMLATHGVVHFLGYKFESNTTTDTDGNVKMIQRINRNTK